MSQYWPDLALVVALVMVNRLLAGSGRAQPTASAHSRAVSSPTASSWTI